jgi:hypothetical protein
MGGAATGSLETTAGVATADGWLVVGSVVTSI